MNLKALSKQYVFLGPEERFRLILAAGARGDGAEQERLTRSGTLLQLSIRDHAPIALAFNELAQTMFLALLDEGLSYVEAFDRACDKHDEESDDDDHDGDESDSAQERMFNLALAAGYLLKVKIEAWKLFCERMNVPPFALWEVLPGYERLQYAIALLERGAFTADGFARWMNRIRPQGSPVSSTDPHTAGSLSFEMEVAFRKLKSWWSGE